MTATKKYELPGTRSQRVKQTPAFGNRLSRIIPKQTQQKIEMVFSDDHDFVLRYPAFAPILAQGS